MVLNGRLDFQGCTQLLVSRPVVVLQETSREQLQEKQRGIGQELQQGSRGGRGRPGIVSSDGVCLFPLENSRWWESLYLLCTIFSTAWKLSNTKSDKGCPKHVADKNQLGMVCS